VAIAKLEVKVESLESNVLAMQKNIQEIRDTLTGVRGSWKALLAVASILSGILITIGMKLWDAFGAISPK